MNGVPADIVAGRTARLLVCAALLAGAMGAYASDEPILLSNAPCYRLGGSWSFLRDDSGTATLADVRTREFLPEERNEPSLGFGSAAHWARFAVRSEAAESEWILEWREAKTTREVFVHRAWKIT